MRRHYLPFVILIVASIIWATPGVFAGSSGARFFSILGGSLEGQITWSSSLGAITHVLGPSDQPFVISSASATGTDAAGANFSLAAGRGTGTGASGQLLLQVAPPGKNGSTANPLATAVTLAGASSTFAAVTPVQVTATVAGNPTTVRASDAVAGDTTAGAAAGGSVTIQAGDAKRLTSGNANGGTIDFKPGNLIGSGADGAVRVLQPGDSTTRIQLGGQPINAFGYIWEGNISAGQQNYALAGNGTDTYANGSAGVLYLAASGTVIAATTGSVLQLGSANQITWDTTALPDGLGSDTGLKRAATNVVSPTDGGAGAGALNFIAMAAPAAVNGNLWHDSTQKSLSARLSGATLPLIGTFFTATASGTVTNTAVEGTVIGTGVGTLTLPATFFVAGKTIHGEVRGIFNTAATPGTLNVKLKLGSTVVVSTTALTPAGSVVNEAWHVPFVITCRTTGASGTVFGHADFYHGDGSTASEYNWNMSDTAAATIDTTGALALDVTATWGTANASNSIVGQVTFVEAVN